MKKIGIGVLAVAFMSNCFLTGYLNEGLKPYNTVTGAQAKQILNAAAGSAWTTALQMYGTSLSTRQFANLTGGYKFTGAADIGDVYEQRALAGVIAAASKTIVDDEYYTVDSLNDCTDNIRNSMIGFGQGRIEEADKAATNCMTEANTAIVKVNGDLNKALAGTCFQNTSTGANNAVLSALCSLCVTNPGSNTVKAFATSNNSLGGLASSLANELKDNTFYMTFYNNAIAGTPASADTLRTARDACADNYMAAFVGKLASFGCSGKFGEERIHEALSTTAFMGAQRCQLKKAGSVIQTDFFSL